MKHVRHSCRECSAHIRDKRFDRCPCTFHFLQERLDAVSTLAIGNVQYGAALHVKHNRHIPVPFADGKFVDAHIAHFGKINRAQSTLEIVLLNLTDQVPTHADVFGNILNCADSAQFNHVPGERTSVTFIGLGERQVLLTHHTAGRTFNTLDGKPQNRFPTTNRRKTKIPIRRPAQADVGPVADGTKNRGSRVASMEHRAASTVIDFKNLHYSQTKTVVQFASGGHDTSPYVESFFQNST